jgi:PAS domain S-box-containing protein
MPASRSPVALLHDLAAAIAGARELEAIYDAAIDALMAIGVSRASILLFDEAGVMRFERWRGISDEYRTAVDGHTPWTPDTADAEPILVSDVHADPSLAAYLPVFDREGLGALGFIPLTIDGRVIGKFMLYHDTPHVFLPEEVRLASTIALQVAFAVERTRRARDAQRSEARLRFALAAANMGTWEWDLRTNAVTWSADLERVHGLEPGTFDGAFESYEREIHADDRERVLASITGTLEYGLPHDVEYRIVAPDGTVRWVEGKGHVERDVDGRPIRMTGVCMNVTRRKVAELERLEYAERAVEANRLKDEFLATLSHELRTPLNAVLGWAHILERRADLPVDARNPVAVIRRNAEAQLRLIEDLLDISRIVSGKLRLQVGPVDVRGAIESAIEAARPAAQARGVTLVAEVPDNAGYLVADQQRFGQILWNLLSNAVKFTDEGGRVSVQVHREPDVLLLEVSDTGEGIPPEFLPFIFDPFRQADGSPSRRAGGLGLGLAITRHLVEQHGGSITAESEGPGRGARFIVRLSARVPEADALVEPAPPAADAPALTGRRALVVDDHADSRELLATLLSRHGAEIVTASSAADARRALGSGPYDLLFLDIGMPGEDGYALMRELRTRGVNTPAVAVTAYARTEDVARARAAGFAAHVAKPVTPESVGSVLALVAGPAADSERRSASPRRFTA